MNRHVSMSAVLARLGIEVTSEKGDEYWALCPGHLARVDKVDNNPSWSINAETGQHLCFSCGYKGNLYTLVRDLSGDKEAREFLDDAKLPIPEGWRVNRSVTIPLPDSHALRTIRESDMALFTEPPDQALADRSITRWASDSYGVRWDPRSGSWIFPLRDPEENKLMGFQIKSHTTRAFRNYPPGLLKGATLFGYHQMMEAESVVVVESPLDAIRLFGLGYNSVALCGSKITEAQLTLLSGFVSVTFGLDNDPAGRAEMDRLARLMPGFMYRAVKWRPDDPKDFGEMEESSISTLLDPRGSRL